VGSTYSDAGATATDNYDGDITASIATVNSVNTNAVGTYAITYDVSDSSGNPATQVTRTVNVVDTSAPIISILGSNPATVEAKAAYVDAGATALDAVDGAVIVTSSSTVNTDELGTYLVTYSATDLHGNTATATRTVTVVDTVAPVISIIGDNPASVEVYAVYADAGATAFDAVDGTVPVVASGTVNTNALGSNTITYSASDSHGNTATATRVVNVVDTTAPTITLIGEMSVTIEIGSTYVDAGASANDNYDGDITAGIVIVNSVNTNAVGSYSITYDVTDSSGNFATQVTRTVNVVDTSAPIISILGSNPATAEAKTAYADAGATALDAVDGVVIVTSSSTVNTDELGTYWVTYSATDSHGNTATATRTVNVVDTTKPEITILGNNPATLEAKTAYADAGAAAFDTVDGTIPVVASGTVNADILGEYTITYVATDSSGNTATATRIVNVVDTTAPIITVLGENPATIEFGLEYSDAGATALDNYDGTITSSIVTVNPVNTSAVGAYVVTYDVSDSSGNHALQSIRTVNVVDTVAPAIALVGSDSVTVEVNTAYTDAGATATDNAPGLVEVTFIDTSNIHVVGEYIISYTATDASGNTASISRTIHVVDTTAPVISLIGENPRSIVFGTEYIDDGATATDNYDEIVMVTTNNPVNPNVVGTYVVTYDATDAAGNSAAQRNRTVNVLPSPLEVELAKAKQDITTALVLNGNPSAGNLLADLYLPIALSSHPGVAIRWDSTNPEAISTSGNVTRPTESDANVNLTATLTLEEFTESVLLEFTVRKAQPAAVPDNGTVTVTTGQDEVVIDATNNDTALLVIVPGNIGSNTTIFVNFAALVNGTGESSEVALPTGINMTRTGPLAINYTAAIPANTTITGPAGWDGLMQVPQVVDSSAFFAPSGTANVVVQFGTGAELNFSQPVMVVLGGMAGKKAAWAHGTGALSDITTACNSATNPTNIGQTGPARECYIDLGADLVIWTYHFTSFSAYTPAQVNGGQKDTYNIYNSGSVYSPNRSSAQATPVPTAVPTQAASTPVVTAHPTATAVPTAQKQFPIAVASENQQEYAELPSSPIEEGPGVQTGLLTANPAGLGILVLLLIGVAAYMIFRKN
ncbi:MAG: immunoglobulin-like domain-containing protein, partial [Candidatus Micrarchaeia archaeon]